MLLFSLSFLLSFLRLLWVALFNNAHRDLPPSRALAIAQGRLDPISMCAFNELACNKHSSPQYTLKQANSMHGDSRDHPTFHEGDAWLGTDEELSTSLAAGEPELSLSPSECTLSLHVRPDIGFLAHLTSISNSKAIVQPSLEEQQTPTGIVVLSPGKKRVFPPAPNNNPFKRGKQLDEKFSLSSKARSFETELDGKLFCRQNQCLEKAISVPQQASHETGQFSHHGAHRSRDSVDIKGGGNQGLIFVKVGNLQDPVHSESTTLAPLHVQNSESQGDIDSRTGGAEVLMEVESAGDTKVSMQLKLKTLASLQADDFGIKPVKRQHTSDSKGCMHPELQASMSPVCKDSVVQQYSLGACTVSISHSMLPKSASRHVKGGTDSPKTSIVTKQLQREVKAQKEIRSSSKQSIKGGLLKFFQREPTL